MNGARSLTFVGWYDRAMKLCLLLATALLTLPAAAADQLSCPVPQGVRATVNMNDVPSGLHRALE